MTIRPGRAEDLDSIRDIAVAAYSLYIERIGRKPAPMVADFMASIEQGHLFVKQDDEQISGFVVFYPGADKIHLENLAVAPTMQQRGVGSALVAFVEAEASRLGCNAVELYTNARMTENLEIYAKLGYEPFDRRFEDGFDRVYFRKML